MATRIISANNVYDLSNIKSLEDIREEIRLLKASLKKDEQELEEHFRSLPRRIVKSTADELLPAFLNKLLANGTWKILLSSAAIFLNPFSKGFSFKRNIVSSAKRLGLITLLKSAFALWSSKRAKKNKPVTHQKKSPAVTTLKTKNFK